MKQWMIGLLFLLCAWTAPAQATILFTEDYEVTQGAILTGGSATRTALLAKGWETVQGATDNPGSVSASVVACPSGGGASGSCARLKYNGIICGPGTSCSPPTSKWDRPFAGQTEVWERFWIRYEPISAGISTMFNGKAHYFNPGSLPSYFNGFNSGSGAGSSGDGLFSHANQSNVSHTCPNGTTDVTCLLLSSQTFQLNTWYCVENHYGASLVETYVNGTARGSWSAIVPVTINRAQLYGQGGGNTYRYEDNWTVATTRTEAGGCGAAPPADTTPPGIPTLTTSASGGGQGNTSWTAATDNVGVQGYEVLRCTGASCTPATIISTPGSSTLFYTDLAVSPSTTYRYAVRAFDAAGNRSGLSNLGSVTTTATYRNTLATDTFTRADNTDLSASYDAGYTGQGPCQIVSNRMRSTTINTRCYETYNATVPGNDQWAQRTISNLTGAQLADQCVLVRAANAATVTAYAGCALVNGSNTFEIREYTTGTPVVSAGNATYTVAAGDKIRLEAEGTTLRLYRVRGTQETLVTSTTDASIASGKAGVTNVVATSGTLSNNESDDLVIGDFGAGTATTVGFESVSESPDNETSNTTSWSHTTTASSNTAFIGCAYARSNVEAHTQVSSYTLGGQALTFVRRDTRNDGASNYFTTEIWRLFGPSPGSATATIVWGGTPRDFGAGTGIGLTNVSAAAGVDANNGSSGTGATASVSLTTVADHAAIVDCAIGRSDAGLTVGAGQTMRADRVVGVTEATNDGVGASTVLDKTPAGAETMDWTQTATDWVISAVSVSPATVTPVIPPTIASLTLSASGATLTAGATTPTRMRVAAGNNANTLSFADNVAWSTSYSKTWPDGYEFACFYPIDSAGVENTESAASKCGSLVGIVQPLDTTPIVMTQTFPTTTLNQGTTSSLFTISIDKAGECKWDTSNTTFALMANTMNVSSLSASADTGAVLSDGTTSHFYTQCQFTNSAGADVPTTTALDVSISVAAGAPTDTTKPSTIADLAAAVLTQAQVLLIWPAATDANGVVSYNIYLCSTTTTCTPSVFAGATGNVTQTVLNLSPLTGYCFDVRGVDPSNNEALASNAPCVTTTAIPDIEPPSTMQNLRVAGGPFTSSVILGWDQGDGTPGQVTSTIEQCTGTGCSDFTVVQSNITTQQLQTNLTPGVLYRFRGIFTDLGSNRSLAYSNIVEVTTLTVGVGVPPGTLPFGVTRDTVTRDAYPTTRDVRP